jgi:hypothetical protein
VKRALIVALLLALLLAAVSLRSYHARGPQPEPSTPVPLQAATSAESIENSEHAIESANALTAPARESLATETNASASPVVPGPNAPVRIRVLYAGSGRPVRAAKAIVGLAKTEARTDEHGVAEVQVLQGHTLSGVRVEACDDGDPFIPYERTLELLVVPGMQEILVRVERGIDIRGIVRAAGTGRVIPGAKVSYEGLGQRSKVESGADGSFLCQALLVNYGNPNPLNIEREGYLPASVKPKSADIEAGATPLIVVLEAGITVAGRVLDSDRRPVAGAYLEIHTPHPFQAVSDEQGQFEFGGLKASEQASLSVKTQARPPIFERSMELGALRASRYDVEFEVQRAIEVRVLAELPDGSNIAPGSFDVSLSDGTKTQAEGIGLRTNTGDPHSGLLSLGGNFELRAYARAPGSDDRSAILTGSAQIHTGPEMRSPLDVHIRLTEPGRLEIPPLPAGAGESDLSQGSDLLGALDVQVLDADSGLPIEGMIDLVYPQTLNFDRGDLVVSNLAEARQLAPGANGWLRIWHNIGSRPATVWQGQRRMAQVTISIPRSGYATSEWRLRSTP